MATRKKATGKKATGKKATKRKAAKKRATPRIVDPCPKCGTELEWNEDHPYQNVYGWMPPTRCPECRWESD